MTDQGAGLGAQRAWRANCSFCGAPVEFQSAASPMAVCSYCRSTLVREGDMLRRIGECATLFDDHSPLALGGRGQFQGESFTLIGRIQLAYDDGEGDEGRWTEWHALFDNGRSGALSEDNGAYVMGFPVQPAQALADEALQKGGIGESILIDGRPWVLSSRVDVRVQAAEGELASQPQFKGRYPVVELRNTAGEVLSVEFEHRQQPTLYLGRAVQLDDLRLSGIEDTKQAAEASLKAKGIECPHCGSALAPTLDSSQTIVCGSCRSVVDISKGLGTDLRYYRQDNTLEPLIPLGTLGRLKVDGKPGDWQVVGYMERCEVDTGAGEDQSFWREYLLYNRMAGFAFLVDALDGWSLVRPVTGAPSGKNNQISYRGKTYQKRYSYGGKTTYVLGEFYWPVKKNQRTLNTDYAGVGQLTHLRLNREQTGKEITWSVGETLSDADVVAAFRIPAHKMGAFKRDSSSFTSGLSKLAMYLLVILVILLVMAMLSQCSTSCSGVRDTYGEYSAEYQQCRANESSGGGHGYSGGSYGGYSSGGSHK